MRKEAEGEEDEESRTKVMRMNQRAAEGRDHLVT